MASVCFLVSNALTTTEQQTTTVILFIAVTRHLFTSLVCLSDAHLPKMLRAGLFTDHAPQRAMTRSGFTDRSAVRSE
jgi:hypothetical protein